MEPQLQTANCTHFLPNNLRILNETNYKLLTINYQLLNNFSSQS